MKNLHGYTDKLYISEALLAIILVASWRLVESQQYGTWSLQKIYHKGSETYNGLIIVEWVKRVRADAKVRKGISHQTNNIVEICIKLA